LGIWIWGAPEISRIFPRLRQMPKTCGSEAGSYLRLIDFVYHPTPGIREIKKKRQKTCRDSGLGIRVVGLELGISDSGCRM